MSMKTKLVDITLLPVDAIVNAAREDLRPGGGVNGAIHAAAGRELADACARAGSCPTGKAIITSAYGLPCRYVVHAVGPVWQGGLANEAELLRQTYRSALQVAHDHRCESVALPAISAGLSGYPLAQAAEIAVEVTSAALDAEAFLEEVIFACYSEAELVAYSEALGALT